MKALLAILTFLGALGTLLIADVKFVTDAISAFPAGQIMAGLQDIANAVGLTAGFFHLHLKWNLFGITVDTGNN